MDNLSSLIVCSSICTEPSRCDPDLPASSTQPFGVWIIFLASFLALSPGVDVFLLPKLVAILVGVVLCLAPQAKRRLRLPFLVLIGAALLSGLCSESPWQAVLGAQNSPTFGVLGLVVAWLCYECGQPGWEEPLLWGALGCAAVALLQYTPECPFPPLGGRAYGTIGSPVFMAGMLAVAAPVAIEASTGAIGLLFIAVGMSGSRAGMLAFLVGMCWTSLTRCGRLYGTLALIAVALLVAGHRLNSDGMRIQTWIIALKAWWSAPLLGVGPDCFTDAFMRFRGSDWVAGGILVQDNAHNLVLHVLATQGLLGLAVWANLGLRAPMTASLAALLAYGMFEPIPFMAWCIIAYQWGALECAG